MLMVFTTNKHFSFKIPRGIVFARLGVKAIGRIKFSMIKCCRPAVTWKARYRMYIFRSIVRIFSKIPHFLHICSVQPQIRVTNVCDINKLRSKCSWRIMIESCVVKISLCWNVFLTTSQSVDRHADDTTSYFHFVTKICEWCPVKIA